MDLFKEVERFFEAPEASAQVILLAIKKELQKKVASSVGIGALLALGYEQQMQKFHFEEQGMLGRSEIARFIPYIDESIKGQWSNKVEKQIERESKHFLKL